MDSSKTIPGTVCEIEVRISEERGMGTLEGTAEGEELLSRVVGRKERQRPEDSKDDAVKLTNSLKARSGVVGQTTFIGTEPPPRKDVADNYCCHKCGLATALHVGPEGRLYCDRCDPVKAGYSNVVRADYYPEEES